MRILSICYEYPPLGGGGAKVVAGLIGELAGPGCTIDLVTMWFPGLPFRERHGDFNIFRIPCVRFDKGVCRMWEMPLYLIVALPVLVWLCLTRRYTLNHTHFVFPDGVLALLLKMLFRLPYVITAHGSDVPGYNPDRFKLAHTLLAPVWRMIVRKADRLVSPSTALADLIDKRDSLAQVEIIPNGIDTDKFTPSEHRKNRILVVTRMFERKGVQYLLQALVGFAHGYEIHIVGDGPYLPVLKRQIDDKDMTVKFWGYLDNQSPEIRDLYERSKIFVFPSVAENCPIVLLEAMASGLAIVTTEGTGCAELVGDAAVLVKRRDAESIRTALETLIADPGLIDELGKAARRRLEERFGWKAVAQRYLSLYRDVSYARQ